MSGLADRRISDERIKRIRWWAGSVIWGSLERSHAWEFLHMLCEKPSMLYSMDALGLPSHLHRMQEYCYTRTETQTSRRPKSQNCYVIDYG
jgi:hypothetical protein